MRGRWGAWLAVAVAALGCTSRAATFHCEDSSQCVHDGVRGVCGADGTCDFGADALRSPDAPRPDAPRLDAPPTPDAAPRPCVGGDETYRSTTGRCFSRHDVAVGFIDAMATCADHGRSLAMFVSEAEELEVQTALVHEPGTAGGYYIGLDDLFVESAFLWLDARPHTYTRWLPGEPQTVEPADGAAGDDAVVLDRVAGGPRGWVDVPTTHLAGALCVEAVHRTAPSGEAYDVIYGLLEYARAAIGCAAGGHVLATITTSAENTFVASLAPGLPVWIGANDRLVEGTFAWTSGAPFGGFTSWAAGEPSGDTAWSAEDCTVVDASGAWQDTVCGFGFIGAAACDEGR